jgi:hypothetical protein
VGYSKIFAVALLLAMMVLPLVLAEASSEAPQLEWSRTYSRPPRTVDVGTFNSSVQHLDLGFCFLQTSDGGYVIDGGLGDSYYQPHGGLNENYSGVIIKTNSVGEIQWEKTYSIPRFYDYYSETGYYASISETKDIGFIISNGNNLLKFDAEGNLQWNKYFGLSIKAVIQLSDGSYTVAGVVDGSRNSESGTLIKTDENGNMLWNKTLSAYPPSEVLTFDIEQTNDGGFITMGTWSDSAQSYSRFETSNLWIVKIDSKGDFQLNKTYMLFNAPQPPFSVGPFTLRSGTIRVTQDGGFILSGGLSGRDVNDSFYYYAPWLAKIDSKGNKEWNQTYANNIDNSSYFVSSVQTKDEGYFVIGSLRNPYNGPTYPLLIKTDQFGTEQWKVTGYSGSWDTGFANSGIVTNEGAYAVTGSVKGDIWLTKFAPESTVNPSPSIPEFPSWVILSVIITSAILLAAGFRRKNRLKT